MCKRLYHVYHDLQWSPSQFVLVLNFSMPLSTPREYENFTALQTDTPPTQQQTHPPDPGDWKTGNCSHLSFSSTQTLSNIGLYLGFVISLVYARANLQERDREVHTQCTV